VLTFGDFLSQEEVDNLGSARITYDTGVVDAWVRESGSWWNPANVLLAKAANGDTAALFLFPEGTVLVVKERPC
jgi:hypothetical protein